MRDGSIAARVIEALRKKPLTSGQVIEAIGPGVTGQGVYAALSTLRASGQVVMWEDPQDAQRKNKLVA